MAKDTAMFKRMSQIAYHYNYVLEFIHGEYEFLISDGKEMSHDEEIKFVARVYRSFDQCSNDEKEILNNDFLGGRRAKGWWLKKYKTDEYKKLAKAAVKHFLENYDSFTN